jgi:hypothetical protein
MFTCTAQLITLSPRGQAWHAEVLKGCPNKHLELIWWTELNHVTDFAFVRMYYTLLCQ